MFIYSIQTRIPMVLSPTRLCPAAITVLQWRPAEDMPPSRSIRERSLSWSVPRREPIAAAAA